LVTSFLFLQVCIALDFLASPCRAAFLASLHSLHLRTVFPSIDNELVKRILLRCVVLSELTADFIIQGLGNLFG